MQRVGGSPRQRKLLFYSVCLVVRTALVVTLLLVVASREAEREVPVAIALAVGLTIAAISNVALSIHPGAKNVWWNRRVHAALLTVTATLAILSAIAPGNKVYVAVGGVLAADILFGFVHSFIRQPFGDQDA